MAFCTVSIQEDAATIVELEEGGGYVLVEGACQGQGGGAVSTFGHVPDWWDRWAERERRKIRMRIPTKERIAALAAQALHHSDMRKK